MNKQGKWLALALLLASSTLMADDLARVSDIFDVLDGAGQPGAFSH